MEILTFPKETWENHPLSTLKGIGNAQSILLGSETHAHEVLINASTQRLNMDSILS